MIRTTILKTNTLRFLLYFITCLSELYKSNNSFPKDIGKKNINQNSTIIQLAAQTSYGLQIIGAMCLEDGGDSIPNI